MVSDESTAAFTSVSAAASSSTREKACKSRTMRWMRAMPSFDSCTMFMASNRMSPGPSLRGVLRPAFNLPSDDCSNSARASRLASTNEAGLLISCATEAASCPRVPGGQHADGG